MRVTLNLLTDRLRRNLAAGAERLFEAQNVASTGKRIDRASDDVPGVGKVLGLRSALAGMEQFKRNADLAESQLSAASGALESATRALQTVRTLAVAAGSAALTDEARKSISSQLDHISTELEGIANTQYLGRYIFAGSRTDVRPMEENPAGDPPYIYQGDDRQLAVQIGPGVLLEANVTGDVVFNIGGAGKPGSPDVFSAIETLSELVADGDVAAISDHLQAIDDVLANVISIRSQVGARLSRLEQVRGFMLDSQIATQELLSKTEDADLADAVIELRTRENVYQAALATAERILQMTLTEYWK